RLDYKYELSEEIAEGLSKEDKIRIHRYSLRLQGLLERRRAIHMGTRRNGEHQKLLDSSYRIPDIIAESRTSGVRIGIVIDSQREDIVSNLALIVATMYHTRCNNGIIITSSIVDLKDTDFMIPINIVAKKDIVRDLEDCLNKIDTMWFNLRRSLEGLETSLRSEKYLSRELINRVENLSKNLENLSKNSGQLPPNYESVYEDILSRIRHDIESSDSMISQLGEHINEHFEYLERKNLFSNEDLADIEDRLKSISKTLREKDSNLTHFEEEIYSMPGNISEYSKYGLQLNPFSLMVPLENTNQLIDQDIASRRAARFIENVMRRTDDNFLLVTGESGIGKSHFLTYFAQKVNDLKSSFGKAVAVKVRCKPNRDILYLYPQLIEGLKKVLSDREEAEINQYPDITEDLKNKFHQQYEQESLNMISKISNNEGTPIRIQDLMKILKSIEQLLKSNGFDAFFIIIDEFENSLPRVHEHKSYHEGLRTLVHTLTPSAVSQLYSLLRLSGIGFIVSLRKEDWEVWQNVIESGSGNQNLINLEPLSLEDSKTFLRNRLEGEEYRAKTSNPLILELNDNSIETIWKNAEGNPRQMLQLASIALKKTVKTRSDIIEPVISG
ncbi:MAG TPA: AAA family ATPase, partial [Nitrososphaeraceae archaeon]|nr:AAA family ATPase [Nitrososphaeraceae archaeon]